MGIDATFVDKNSKDQNAEDEVYNFKISVTIGNGNLRSIDRFPFLVTGFNGTLSSLHRSTVAKLDEWLLKLKIWIQANIGKQFDTYTVSEHDARIVEALRCEIKHIPGNWIVYFW